MTFTTLSETFVQNVSTETEVIQVSESELSEKSNVILRGAQQCQMKTTGSDSSDSVSDSDYAAACLEYIELLKKELTAAKNYAAPFQLEILQKVAVVLSAQNDESPLESKLRRDLIINYNYELFDIVQPFQYIAGKDAKARLAAIQLFRIIVADTPHRELHLWASEYFSTIDWDDLASDIKQCIQATVQSVEWLKALGQVFEQGADDALYENIQYPMDYCVKVLEFIGNVLQFRASWGSSARQPSEWDAIAYTLSESMLDLVEFGTKRFPPLNKSLEKTYTDKANDNEGMRCRYLFLFLLTQCYADIIRHLDMRFGQAYYEQYHPEYNIKTPDKSSGWIHTFKENERDKMLNIVHRCMDLTVASGVSFDDLWRLANSVSLKRNSKHPIHSKKHRLSSLGIASLLAVSVYDQCIYEKAHSMKRRNMFPSDVDFIWLGREFLGILTSSLHIPEDMACVDKALMVFCFLADNADIEVTIKMYDERLKDIDGKLSKGFLLFAFQAVTSVACMSANRAYRFLALQLVSTLLWKSTDDARLLIIMFVFEKCPLVELNAEIVGILKDLVSDAFQKEGVSAFNSRVVVDKFFPPLFEPKSGWTAKEFADEAEYNMKVLHFYYVLLKLDKGTNKTTVWNPEVYTMVNKNLLEPLRKALERLSVASSSNRSYLPQQDLSQTPRGDGSDVSERVQREMLMQILLKDAIERIETEINEK